jgi:lysylphosphatidylglycerol synthetase-like protein (DUF2156 family)
MSRMPPGLDVAAVLRSHANHPSAFLATNEHTQHFCVPGVDGMIAYRHAGSRYVVMVAGLHAPEAQKAILLDHFMRWAQGQRRRVIGVQFLKEDAELLGSRGFRVNQIGASYSRSLDSFKLAGTPFIKLRNKISKARRAGVEVQEVGGTLEVSPELQAQLTDIDSSWLSTKGSHAKELAFLVGQVGPLASLDRSVKRLFVALQGGRAVGYVLYTASFGHYQGWMHDLSRRLADAPTGVMELINATAIERFKTEKVPMLNYGFTPLTSLGEKFELSRYHSRMAGWVFEKLARHGSFIYPSVSQLQYKMKWAPDIVEPEYIAFQGGFSLGGLWNFLRLTRAI